MGKSDSSTINASLATPVRIAIAAVCLTIAFPLITGGTVVETKSGLEFQGVTDSISSIGVSVLHPNPIGGPVDVEPIVVIDDGLRRTFIPKQQIANHRPDVETLERIKLKQNVCLLHTSPSPRDATLTRMPSSA